jgi:hypothetical protein
METLEAEVSIPRKPVQRITEGDTDYSLKGSMLLISREGKTHAIELAAKFVERGIDPAYADMRLDDYPPRMGLEGKLLYIYSPGSKSIVIVSPQTLRKSSMDVPASIRSLRSVAFEAKSGIIALSGPGADFLAIIGLGDLRKSETYPLQIGLQSLLSNTGAGSLHSPRLEIIGNKVYLQDRNIGRGRYFFEVRGGVPLDIPVRDR